MEVNTQPFNRTKSRKALKYKKITNQAREKLIEMVFLKEIPLKNAADSLNINYSTAKTILRIFRVEKRMAKKNSIDESELKKLLIQLKNKKNTDCNEGNLKSETNDKENVILSGLNDMNQKLDMFNERLLDYKDILQNSFQNIISSHQLIQDVLDITRKIQENLVQKESFESQVKIKSNLTSSGVLDNMNLFHSLSEQKKSQYWNGLFHDWSNEMNSNSTINSYSNQSSLKPLLFSTVPGHDSQNPGSQFMNMIEAMNSYDLLNAKKISLNYKYFN